MFRGVLKFDWILIVSSFLLLGVGLIALYSISSGTDDGPNIFLKQLIFSILGVAIMIFLYFFDYRFLRLYSNQIYFVTLGLLALVLIWGSTIRGTSGWLGFGSFNVQPVEIAKLSLIIFLASFISKKKTELGGAVRLIASFVLSGIMIFFVIRQPDFGSSMVLLGIWLGMMVFSGINKKHLLIIIISIALVGAGSWSLLKEYQRARIISVVQPEIDPQGSGYNVIQSMVAVGSGGIFGKGIGHGSQSQLNFLPEKHTDFIFAVIVEEMGFFGSLFVLSLYLILFYRMKKIADSSDDNFGYLITLGIMIMFFVQILVNVGMNIGVMPVTGIPLPILSYGGSSLVSVFASLGILLNIHARRRKISKSQVIHSY